MRQREHSGKVRTYYCLVFSYLLLTNHSDIETAYGANQPLIFSNTSFFYKDAILSYPSLLHGICISVWTGNLAIQKQQNFLILVRLIHLEVVLTDKLPVPAFLPVFWLRIFCSLLSFSLMRFLQSLSIGSQTAWEGCVERIISFLDA